MRIGTKNIHIEADSYTGLFFGFSIIALITYFIALWTESNIEFWAAHYGNPVDIPLWLSWLISLLLSVVILIINVVSEILELFV